MVSTNPSHVYIQTPNCFASSKLHIRVHVYTYCEEEITKSIKQKVKRYDKGNPATLPLQTIQQAAALEEQDDLVHDGADVLLGQVNGQIDLLRSLIRVVDTGEALDLAGAGSLVDALAVRLLAVLERRGNVDQEKGTRLFNKLSSVLASILIGRNGGSDDGSTGLGQLRGNKGDATNVQASVLAAEAQLGGELGAHRLTQQQRHGSTAALVQRRLEGTCDLVLAGVLVARQEDGEALFPRQWVLLSQHLDHLGVREPLGNLLAGPQAVSQLGTGNVHGAGALGDLVGRHVLVAVWDVNHLLELDHLDAELLAVLLHEDLRIIRAVVVLAVLVLAGAGVVTADDEVRGAVVLADDGVPQSLTGTAHSHGQRQQGESSHAVGVSGQQSAVDADAGEVVDIARLGQADNGVDEHVGLLRTSSPDRQLTVSAVHGVSGLEGDDLLPAELVEVGSQFSGGDCTKST